MRAIFISYRRDDAEGHAGRLFRDLCERFGSDAVFMDVAGIEPGSDFRRVIDQQVASCGVLLAVIGRNWLGATGVDGHRRLDDPLDFVRLETAAALRRGIPVVPVLVHEAQMPRPQQLPDELKDLAYRNAVELSHTRWDSDLEILVRALRRQLDAAGKPPAAGAPTAAAAPPAAAAAPAGVSAVPRRRARLPGLVATALAVIAAAGGGAWVYEARQQAERDAQQARQMAEQQVQTGARVAAEEAERARLEARLREQEAALAAARAEADRAARAQDEAARASREREQAARAAAERAAADKAAAARAAEERAAALQADRDRLASEASAAKQAAARRPSAPPAHWVGNMRLDPAPPATLPVGSPVRMSFDYATAQSAAVQVVAIPMIGGAAAPDLDLRPAKGLDPGRGSGVAEFGVRKGPANVDGVRVRMYAAQQKEPLFETTLPARYAFSPAIAAQPPTAAKVQIVGAQCTRTGPDTYRVDVSGGASGPQQATLFIGVDVRFLSQPRPTLEVECGQWQRLSANSCTRADTPVAGTRWAYRHGFGSSQPPTHAMANVYDGPNPKTAKRIAEHRVEIDCR